jgi:anti-sigma factor RsiW
MVMTENKTMCAGMETKLADLLLDPESVSARVKAHVDACEGCREELAALRATMGAMDAWQAPEPNPYFMTRFEARLREEKNAPRPGWLARLRDRWLFSPQQLHARPLAAMALTVAVLVGGGAYLNSYWEQPPAQQTPQTAVVHDLQTLDSNAQLLDQLESISADQQNNGPAQD